MTLSMHPDGLRRLLGRGSEQRKWFPVTKTLLTVQRRLPLSDGARSTKS